MHNVCCRYRESNSRSQQPIFCRPASASKTLWHATLWKKRSLWLDGGTHTAAWKWCHLLWIVANMAVFWSKLSIVCCVSPYCQEDARLCHTIGINVDIRGGATFSVILFVTLCHLVLSNNSCLSRIITISYRIGSTGSSTV